MNLVPAAARAVELLGESQARWTGHYHTREHWPAYGPVITWHVWMIVREATPEVPELGIVWTWLILPRQPIRCVHAMAYRADWEFTIESLFDIDTERPMEYLDSLQLSPEMAWAMAAHPDPGSWYQALTEGTVT